ncbi:Glyoxalase/Bleomycin resistance protein/Dihydroxybiphenyl dioxygenase [Thozetella sp. PMI_491]|nr:Glyoxalase/Bleomycin resistance protein/Dihydroxybiphenyl dioxygenase [Thozetella sp. PMI_491]
MGTKKINVLRLSAVHYQHPDLERAEKFFAEFGLVMVAKDERRIFFSGFGIDPYIYLAEKSPDSQRRFIGGTWAVESESDLKTAASYSPGARIVENNGPGGGRKITLTDPNGFQVTFVHGQKLRTKVEGKAITLADKLNDDGFVQNMAHNKPRVGEFRRFDLGPSPVHKLGHYGFSVPASKFEETRDWYISVVGVTPTDSLYDPETGQDKLSFLHIDRGLEYVDHHSFFLGATAENLPAVIQHCSFEVNDFDTQCVGHDFLKNQGWTNCWGIGRHVLGSQIFDYWFDSSENIVEHYADGDLVNSQTVVTRAPESPNSHHIWGPQNSLGFVTARIEDLGKPIPGY